MNIADSFVGNGFFVCLLLFFLMALEAQKLLYL